MREKNSCRGKGRGGLKGFPPALKKNSGNVHRIITSEIDCRAKRGGKGESGRKSLSLRQTYRWGGLAMKKHHETMNRGAVRPKRQRPTMTKQTAGLKCC